MRFYRWYVAHSWYSKEGSPCWRYALNIKSNKGYIGYMFYENKLTLHKNFDNPEHLNDRMFHESVPDGLDLEESFYRRKMITLLMGENYEI